MTKLPKRSAAAKAAAKKAQATRRRKAAARAAILSERALKAWETRRANGWVHPSKR